MKQRKVLLSTLLLTLFAAPTLTSQNVYVARSGVTLHTGMSAESPSPCWFNANTKLRVESTTDANWLKTKACKTVGYVLASETSPTRVKVGKHFMYAKYNLLIADATGKVVSTIKANSKVEVFEIKADRAVVRDGKRRATVQTKDLLASKNETRRQPDEAAWTQVLASIAQGLSASQRQVSSATSAGLLLFGGRDHKVFLGCLNCGRFDSASICNRFGDNGSRFAANSIWSRFGDHGSRFSSYSPWNRFATDPPVIVDREGNFYGYFTSNRFHGKRTTSKQLLAFLDDVEFVNEDLDRARDLFCGD